MSKLKVLSGREIVSVFEQLGFCVENQKGSHIKLKRIKEDKKQTLTIPDHKELDKGTLKAIYNRSLRYVSEEKLKEHFYSNIK